MDFKNQKDIFNMIYYISLIEDLARKSKNGYMPLSKAIDDDSQYHIVFDDKQGLVSDNYIFFPIVQNSRYTGEKFLPDNMKVSVVRERNKKNFHAVIEIDPSISEHGDIIIQDGRWYFA